MSDNHTEPYRPLVSIHIGDKIVTIMFFSEARILWMGHCDVDCTQDSDWTELCSYCSYLFPKCVRILINSRPFPFLQNMYNVFKEHTWKFVFIKRDVIEYKFSNRFQKQEIYQFAEDWLEKSKTIEEIKEKLRKSLHREHLCFSLLTYMTYVTSFKHEVSNYKQTLQSN